MCLVVGADEEEILFSPSSRTSVRCPVHKSFLVVVQVYAVLYSVHKPAFK